MQKWSSCAGFVPHTLLSCWQVKVDLIGLNKRAVNNWQKQAVRCHIGLLQVLLQDYHSPVGHRLGHKLIAKSWLVHMYLMPAG